jgi:RNA polymerase sigma-70 factor (ECF subfamily)
MPATIDKPNNLADLSDERLAVLAAKDNREALEILVSRYLKVIYIFIYHAVASREEAEDLTQEVFVKVWKNLSKFNSDRAFRPWLYKIAKNTYLDYYKKRRPSPWSALGESALVKIQPLQQVWSTAGEAPEEAMDKELLRAGLAAATRQLESSSAEMIILHHESDLSFREIAEIKREPLNTVKSRYRRAISKIKKYIN